MPHRIKANDRKPSIQTTLSYSDGTVPNFTGAIVSFIMRRKTGTAAPKVNAPAVIVNATTGVIRYDWTAADTDSPGEYLAEWEVTFADGLPQTFPTDAYDDVLIYADLDAAP